MGGSENRQATTIPPKTPQELELEQLNLNIARRQSQAMALEEARLNPALMLAQLTASRPAPASQQQAFETLDRSYLDPARLTTLLQDANLPESVRNASRQLLSNLTEPAAGPGGRNYLDPTGGNPLDAWTHIATIKAGLTPGSVQSIDSPALRAELQQRIEQQRADQQLLQAGGLGLGGPGAQGGGGIGGLALSQREQDLIDQLYASARTTGEQDIRRYAESLGAQRGLRLTDSPIGDEALRQQERLVLGLRGAQAGTTLDLNVNARNFGETQRQFNTSFQEGLRQFQQALLQQATQNRMALAGMQPAGLGLGLDVGFRNRQANVSTIGEFSPSLGSQVATGFQTAGQFAAGIGQLAQGLGKLAHG